jgi:hypothetical protein
MPVQEEPMPGEAAVPAARVRRTRAAAAALVLLLVGATAACAPAAKEHVSERRPVLHAVDRSRYGAPDRLFAPDSPWNTPIERDAVVDPDSDRIVAKVLNAPDLLVNLDLISFGQPFFTADASTPRVVLGGRNPIGAIPIDPAWAPNPGADAKMNVIDPTTHSVYELQGYDRAARTVYWAVRHDYRTSLADGYPEDGLAGPTGSGMSQAAGTIRAADLEAGSIDHALSFISSEPVRGFRYPASHSDGTGSGIGIQEGMRVQLDPSIDVDAIKGMSRGERMIARALQRYGAFCTDTGRRNNQAMGFYVERPTPSTQHAYDAAGLTEDWQVLDKLPRGSLRVLGPSATPRPAD